MKYYINLMAKGKKSEIYSADPLYYRAKIKILADMQMAETMKLNISKIAKECFTIRNGLIEILLL